MIFSKLILFLSTSIIPSSHALTIPRSSLSINTSQYKSFNQFSSLSLSCPVGCTELGNCNLETGTCECPWPRRGPTCEKDPLSLCYDDPTNHTVPSCGTWAPKNCECYKQCQSVHCPSGGGTSECEHHLGSILGESRCFLYRGRSSAQQDSGVPRNGSDDVDWYQVPSQGPLEWLDWKPRTEHRLPEQKKWFCKGSAKEHVTSLEDCPQHCSSRGVCVKSHHGGVRCVCRMGFKGLACELDDNEEACWFSPTCNGHGKCKSGFCHCDPGWWGLGCTRSNAYALEPESKAVPSRHRLKIYMYDIPSEYTFPGEHEDGDFQRDVNYIAYEYFLRYFLNDWEVRTQNPYEANLFFIPMLVYFYVHNVQNPSPHIQRVVHYVSTSFPFWNRTGGRDHFWWMTGDFGACWMPHHLMETGIKIVHFGMSGTNLNWRQGYKGESLHPEYACYLPERDIMATPVIPTLFPNSGKSMELFKKIKDKQGKDGLIRPILFFFAGGIRDNDPSYSGSARQVLVAALKGHNYSDVLVATGAIMGYNEKFLTSQFCFSPYGSGWGLRLVISLLHACIPVIVQDHVWQPFEELLPYPEFSVRLRVQDIPNLVPILRSYRVEELDTMRFALAKHWSAFLWPRGSGGSAYNYTLAALRKRLHNLASEYYLR